MSAAVLPDLWLALATGLVGGVGHCAGMCGPLVAAVSLQAGPRAGWRAALPLHLLYNAGRVTTYACAGMAMGLVGSFADVAARMAGLQGAVSAIAGGLMILMGLGTARLLPAAGRAEARVGGIGSRLLAGAHGLLAAAGSGRIYVLGLLLGLLPCGLSYWAFMGAAATAHPARGALFALAFGIGTAPSLLVVGGASAAFAARIRGGVLRAAGLAAAGVGLLFLLRGLGVHAL